MHCKHLYIHCILHQSTIVEEKQKKKITLSPHSLFFFQLLTDKYNVLVRYNAARALQNTQNEKWFNLIHNIIRNHLHCLFVVLYKI